MVCTVARAIDIRRASHAECFMRALCVITGSPIIQNTLGISNVFGSTMVEELFLHRLMKALDFTLRLRVLYPAVNRQDAVIHKPLLKLRIAMSEAGKLGAVVGKNRIRHTELEKCFTKVRNNRIRRTYSRFYAYQKSAVIVEYVKREAIVFIYCKIISALCWKIQRGNRQTPLGCLSAYSGRIHRSNFYCKCLVAIVNHLLRSVQFSTYPLYLYKTKSAQSNTYPRCSALISIKKILFCMWSSIKT